MSAALDPRVLLAIAVGGGLGSMLRYVIGVLVAAQVGAGFPWGTLLINITGSLAIGVVSEITRTASVAMPNYARLFWMVGVLGGYTTFSTFSLDAVTLFGERAPWLAVGYLGASVILGVVAAFIGMMAVRAVMTPW
jgi:fluoride exporter